MKTLPLLTLLCSVVTATSDYNPSTEVCGGKTSITWNHAISFGRITTLEGEIFLKCLTCVLRMKLKFNDRTRSHFIEIVLYSIVKFLNLKYYQLISNIPDTLKVGYRLYNIAGDTDTILPQSHLHF